MPIAGAQREGVVLPVTGCRVLYLAVAHRGAKVGVGANECKVRQRRAKQLRNVPHAAPFWLLALFSRPGLPERSAPPKSNGGHPFCLDECTNKADKRVHR